MSKSVKALLFIINIVMILLSIKWYLKNNEEEPLISILGQLSALIVLLLEGKINTVINANKNVRSKLDLDVSKGDLINANKNENSDIKIKTRD
ncbi:hypothetical protein [Flavobacterium okayamense]|uniref:Uncharacterized protein n=1 Tax=Flavobacterium okayamense TaxID=2830782 RepID=A0ABM7S9B3_9FLAO|nr:hypothetical protein [Flavobacterium okayamense]BCY29356.1 hypothetical protein KK2020170_22240 [Flavobacterium okayamense]